MWDYFKVALGIGFGYALGFVLGDYAGENLTDWIEEKRTAKVKVIK